MPELLCRHALYDLVWSEPVSALAKRLGVSGPAIAKACHKLHVPTPPRGYWARKAAAKPAIRTKLPPRPPGVDDETMIGGGPYWRYNQPRLSEEELRGPVPTEPVFEEPIEPVRKRVEAAIRQQRPTKEASPMHLAVAKLFAADDARQEAIRNAHYVSPWQLPRYQTPVERRRLKFVSSTLRVAAPFTGRAEASSESRYDPIPVTSFTVHVGQQTVQLRAVAQEPSKRSGRAALPSAAVEKPITISVGCDKDAPTWEDGPRQLEEQVREVAVAFIMHGEEQHRSSVLDRHRWRVQARADLIERRRREREAAEQEERERLAELERQRVERLLLEADSLRKAETIRSYAADVLKMTRVSPGPVDENALMEWAEWAHAQADRIDPIRNGALARRIDQPR